MTREWFPFVSMIWTFFAVRHRDGETQGWVLGPPPPLPLLCELGALSLNRVRMRDGAVKFWLPFRGLCCFLGDSVGWTVCAGAGHANKLHHFCLGDRGQWHAICQRQEMNGAHYAGTGRRSRQSSEAAGKGRREEGCGAGLRGGEGHWAGLQEEGYRQGRGAEQGCGRSAAEKGCRQWRGPWAGLQEEGWGQGRGPGQDFHGTAGWSAGRAAGGELQAGCPFTPGMSASQLQENHRDITTLCSLHQERQRTKTL